MHFKCISYLRFPENDKMVILIWKVIIILSLYSKIHIRHLWSHSLFIKLGKSGVVHVLFIDQWDFNFKYCPRLKHVLCSSQKSRLSKHRLSDIKRRQQRNAVLNFSPSSLCDTRVLHKLGNYTIIRNVFLVVIPYTNPFKECL